MTPARLWLWGIALAAALAFLPALRNDYVHDDIPQVGQLGLPQGAREWLEAPLQPWWPRADKRNLWRPIPRMSILLQKVIQGERAWPYYGFNIALHGLASLLLFAVARRMGLREWAAGAGALVFALHPIHAEAVHQIVGRAESFSTVFMLAGLYFFLRLGPRNRHNLWLQPLCYALALGSKEHAAIYPCFLALALASPSIDFLKGNLFFRARARARNRNRDRNPQDPLENFNPDPSTPKDPRNPFSSAFPLSRVLVLFSLLALVLAIFLWARAALTGGLLEPASTVPLHENPLAAMTFGPRLPAVLGLFGYVASRVVWPVGLCPDYSARSFPFEAGWGWGWSWVGALLLCVTLILALRNVWRGGRGWALAAAALIAYGFISNGAFVIGVDTAERLWYWPSVPVCLGLGWAAGQLREKLEPERRRLAGLTLGLVAVGLLSATWAYAPAWRSGEDFARWTIARFPQNWRGHLNLSREYYNRRNPEGQKDLKDFEDGLAEAREAVRILPRVAIGWDWLGLSAMFLAGHEAEAEAAFRRALELDPSLDLVHLHLANLLEVQGRRDEAIRELQAHLAFPEIDDRPKIEQRLDRLLKAQASQSR